MTCTLRPETPADEAVIEALTASAFRHAPHASHTEQFIVNALRRAGQLAVSLAAEQAGEMVGHVAMSPVTVSGQQCGWYGLGPISVMPEHQRHGIGSRLTRAALSALRQLQAQGCVVLGEPGYYSRFGFAPRPALVLPGVPPAYFQALSFSGSFPSGTVAYHAAFQADH